MFTIIRPLLLILSVIYTHARIYNDFLHRQKEPQSPSDIKLGFSNFTQVVTALNYPVEVHNITTEDGYILTWFRIQAKFQQSIQQQGKPVILCMHGVGDSGDTFVINDEKDSVGLRLADSGYDVWIGNVRGTKYGLAHTTLNPSEEAFWQFSWQNMSLYDIPAGFQYIHDITNANITYIGHSQGTTIMFAALSEHDPTVLQYLQTFIALAPVTYVQHVQSGLLKYLANSSLPQLFMKIGQYSFLEPSFFDSAAGHLFCKIFDDVCGNMLSKIYGFDPTYDNYNQINIILEHEPGGTSTVNLIHWQQLVHNGRFCKYDYGSAEENTRQYGQATPPDYNLSNINFPVSMFYGTDDAIISGIDSKHLMDSLTGLTADQMQYKYYPADHMTWLWSKNISFYYDDLINRIKRLNFTSI